LASADTVDLGPGDDGFATRAPYSPGLSVTGGEGTDSFDWALPDKGKYTVDAAAGQFRGPGGLSMSFTGFESYGASTLKNATWSFLGTDVSETVFGSTRDLTRAWLGGGDDHMLFVTVKRARQVDLDGGLGQDRVELLARHSTARVVVDLGRGRYHLARGPRGRLAEFEDAYVDSGDVRLVGSDRADILEVVACSGALVDAGRGDDTVRVSVRSRNRCDGTVPRLLGGPGGDALVGSQVHDLIVGGPGRDTADGSGARDTCRSVETRIRCELS
jgi:D-alanyl-D-alanine carboxypeptidase